MISTLSESPVFRQIERSHDLSRTGVLPLQSGQGESVEVVFREGMIDAVSIARSIPDTFLSGRRLGHYLVEEASLSSQDLSTAQSEARRRKLPLGEAAVRRHLIDDAGLQALARRQAIDLIEHAIAHGFEPGEFAPDIRLYRVPARIGIPHLLLELSRRDSASFMPVAGDSLVLSSEDDLSAFPWYPLELAVLARLEQPVTFEALVESTGLDPAVVGRVLGVLDRLELIETGDAGSHETGGVLSLGEETSLARTNGSAGLELVPSVCGATLDEKLAVVASDASFSGEQFKTLKVQISEEAETGQLRKVFAVSSAEAQDGKSLVSAGLAMSFAMDPHRRVAIVDCDLRNPAVGRYFGISDDPGLIQYLTNGSSPPYCYMRRTGNLFLLTAGGVAPNPIELLSMARMRQLIDYLQTEFDTIILDAPPYLPIADARLVTGLSDGLIFVVRRGRSSYGATDHAFRAIDRNKLLGVVFNDVKSMLLQSYVNQGYYGYGYGASDRQKSAPSPRKPRNYLDS